MDGDEERNIESARGKSGRNACPGAKVDGEPCSVAASMMITPKSPSRPGPTFSLARTHARTHARTMF